MRKFFLLVALSLILCPYLPSAPAPLPRVRKPEVLPRPRLIVPNPMIGTWKMVWRGLPFTATFHANGTYTDEGCSDGKWVYDEKTGRLMVDEFSLDGELMRSWGVCFREPWVGFEDCGLEFCLWKD